MRVHRSTHDLVHLVNRQTGPRPDRKEWRIAVEAERRWLSKLPPTIQRALRCPACRSSFEIHDEHLYCTNFKCGELFPVIDGIPILINDSASIFSIDDFVRRRHTFFQPPEGEMVEMLKRRIPRPTISKNIAAKHNY